MPLSISSAAIVEKNKIGTTSKWIIFLEITYPGETPVRLNDSNETLTWNGETWYPLAFNVGTITQSNDGSIQNVSISFHDVERRITPFLDEYAGGVGATCTLYEIVSSNIASATPEDSYTFVLLSTDINYDNMINIEMGAENLRNYRFPPNRYLKNHCRYKDFKGTQCGYSGAETTCDRTFTQCRNYGNEERFGGFPAIGRVGIFK